MSRFTESGLCSELLAMGKIVLCNGGKIGVVFFLSLIRLVIFFCFTI